MFIYLGFISGLHTYIHTKYHPIQRLQVQQSSGLLWPQTTSAMKMWSSVITESLIKSTVLYKWNVVICDNIAVGTHDDTGILIVIIVRLSYSLCGVKVQGKLFSIEHVWSCYAVALAFSSTSSFIVKATHTWIHCIQHI